MTSLRFQITRGRGTPLTDAELLADLKRVSELRETRKVSQPLYEQYGQFDARNIARRFGTWNKALVAASLDISNEIEYSDERLFSNILTLWQHYGRQPTRAALANLPSEISQSPYQRRFNSWTGALQAFAEWANSTEVSNSSDPIDTELGTRLRAGRDPSLRLRFKVLNRDRFTCCTCGSSPATKLGVELHVDHIFPWSKGGETIFENLQTLCLKCNLGKSNVF